MKIVDKIPDGCYYSRFPKDCPVRRDGTADRNGTWITPIGIVVIKSATAHEGDK